MNVLKAIFSRCRFMLLVLAVLAVYGCGGSNTTTTVALSGTVASGAAITHATVTIKGANGVVATATTDARGYYSANISNLTTPYLLKVTNTAGDLYSVANAAGTVNIHPLTDLIIRTWYKVQGTSIVAAFADPVAEPPPSATELGLIVSVVEKLVQKWIVAAGLDTISFDLFTTPFKADATGFDGFLDDLTVDFDRGALQVDTADSGVEQTTALDINAGDIAATTTMVAGSVTSSNFTSAYILTTDAEEAALTGVLTTLTQMATIINSKGDSLADTDLLPYFASNYQSRGLTRGQGVAALVNDMVGIKLNSFTIDHVLSFDAGTNVISLVGKVSITQKGMAVEQLLDDKGVGLFFKKQLNGSWLLNGNQQHARVQVNHTIERRMTDMVCDNGCDGLYYALQAQVGAPVGTVVSATITGSINGSQKTLALSRNGLYDIENGVETERFELFDANGRFYQLSPENFVSAGTRYAFTVYFVDGNSETYTSVLGASTSESFTLQADVETTVGHDANVSLGSPVTLRWNLPVSFPIKAVHMDGYVTGVTTGVGCKTEGPKLAATATSGTITLPQTCAGESVDILDDPGINIVVEGINGEQTNIWYGFRDSPR